MNSHAGTFIRPTLGESVAGRNRFTPAALRINRAWRRALGYPVAHHEGGRA